MARPRLFFAAKDGYAQLGRLCEIIDAVGKTEGRGAADLEVPRAHIDLLLAAARCAFAMVKELRLSRPITDVQRTEWTRLDALYKGMPQLFHREKQTEQEVDALFAAAKKGA